MVSLQCVGSLISKPPVEIECPELCNPQSKVVKYSMEWTLPQDWSEFVRLGRVLTLRSPVFRFGQDKELEACIVAYITRKQVGSPLGNVALYLEMVSSYKSSISGKLEFVCNRKTPRGMMLTQDTITPGRGWGFKDVMQGEYIFPPTYSEELGKDIYKLTVSCSISLVEDKLSVHSAAKQNLCETQTSNVLAFVPKDPQPRKPIHPRTMSSPVTAGRLRSSNNASKTHEGDEIESDSNSEQEHDGEVNDMAYDDMTYGILNSHLRGMRGQDLSAKQRSTGLPHSDHTTQRSVGLFPVTKSQPSVGDKKSFLVSYLWPAIVTVLAIMAVLFFYPYEKHAQSNSVDELTLSQLRSRLRDDIGWVERDFPAQMRDVWPGFVSGISSVLQSDSTVPSIFLLLHDQDESGVSSCLARRVAQVARRAMNATMQTPLVVSGAAVARDEELADDWGRFVERYRPLVQDHGVMVLTDLQAVPPDVARSLHVFCDQVTPLVGRAIYIFTLSGSQAAQGGAGATEMAERRLNAAWHRLESDVRQALIVRVTGGAVFNVAPELGSGQC